MEKATGIDKNNKKRESLFLPNIPEENTLHDVLEKLNKMEEKLDILIGIVEKNTGNCEKMSSHIDFIEHVYEGLRSPLDYLRWKMGFSSGRQLPELDDNKSK